MIAYSVNQSDPRQLNCRSNIRLMGKSVIRIIYKETHYLHDMHKYDAVHL